VIPRPVAFVLAGAAIGGALLFVVKHPQSAGQSIGGAAVDLADGIFSGVVFGISDRLGVPRTDQERGREALDRGDYWGASLYLPAGDFISGMWNKFWN